MTRTTEAPAWIELAARIICEVSDEHVASALWGMVTACLVTLALFLTFGNQIMLAFPHL